MHKMFYIELKGTITRQIMDEIEKILFPKIVEPNKLILFQKK